MNAVATSRTVRPAARVRALVITALSALILCAGATLTAGRAAAVWLDLTTEHSRAGHLMLQSTPATPQWIDVRAGQHLHWLVTAALDDADSGELELELHAEGSLVVTEGLTVEVSSCSAPFTESGDPDLAPACPGHTAVVQPRIRLTDAASNLDGDRYPLAELHRGAPLHLLVTLAVPSDADVDGVGSGTARVGIGFHAADPGRAQAPGPDLATTGADAAALALLAAGGIGLIVGTVLLRRAAHPPLGPGPGVAEP